MLFSELTYKFKVELNWIGLDWTLYRLFNDFFLTKVTNIDKMENQATFKMVLCGDGGTVSLTTQF